MMKNFDEFGKQMQQDIEKAIKTGDFSNLNRSVTYTVERAADSIFGRVADGIFGRSGQVPSKKIRMEMPPVLYRPKQRAYRTGGILLRVFGGIGIIGSVSWIIFWAIVLALWGESAGWLFWITAILGFMTLGISVGMIRGGISMSRRLERFTSYIRTLNGREYADVAQLSEAARCPSAKTVKDLLWMIRKQWFLQGHLDEQNKCFMLTDHMYGEYRRLEEQRKKNASDEQERARIRQREKENIRRQYAQLPEHVQKVLEMGEAFIQEIRGCNDRIPGEEISRKIDHMERIVRTIFDRLARDPNRVSDVQKMLDYYLPMSVKLLKTYEEMDRMPVKGEHIRTSLTEIEKTIDTLDHAFENLLNDLFLHTSWDVSADIAVLRTMLDQEGLTGEKGLSGTSGSAIGGGQDSFQ